MIDSDVEKYIGCELFGSFVEKLIQSGANVDYLNTFGQSLSELACVHGMADTASTLLESGATVDAPDSDGETPLRERVAIPVTEALMISLAY